MTSKAEGERCSFCGGRPEDENGLVAGGGPEAGDLPRVSICADCVTACGEALQIERRLGEARASQRPPARAASEPNRIGLIQDWTPFTMEGKALEWQASRSLTSEQKPRTLINVRARGKEQTVTVEVEGNVTVTLEHAAAAVGWLLPPTARRAAADRGVVQDWTPFEHEGRSFEFCVERAPAFTVAPKVLVSVRDPATGRSSAMIFDPRIEPSVDEAVMAATASFRDARDLDDEVPDAVVT